MKQFKWLFFLLIVFCSGCATIPARPITRSDIPVLIGKWKGSMSVPAYGQTGYAARFQRSVELEIFNSRLRGTLTQFFGKQAETYPFLGRIDNGTLAARWKNIGWMKLRLQEAKGKTALEGDYEFRATSGSISLNKVP